MAANRTPPRRQRGAVAVLVAVTTVLLVTMLGLVLDLGHLYIVKTELQNAADACVLSAVWEISPYDGTNAARAIAAGQAVAATNRFEFQSRPVELDDGDIEFSEAIEGPYSGEVTRSTRYVRCTTHYPAGTSVVMWIMGLWGTFSSELTAAAAAGIQLCGFPLAFCTNDPAPAPQFPWGFAEGGWYDGRLDRPETGHVGWVSFGTQGTDELRGLIEGRGYCRIVEADQKVLATGLKQALAEAWNTRFGLYKSKFDPETSPPPDYTGYAYAWNAETSTGSWPPPASGCGATASSCKAFDDFRAKQNGHVAYSPNEPQYVNALDSGLPASAVRDRRLVIMPVVKCIDYSTPSGQLKNAPIEVQGWACGLLLGPILGTGQVAAEYRGAARNSPCLGNGLAGSANVPQLVR